MLKIFILIGVYIQKCLETTLLEGPCLVTELHKIYKPVGQQALASYIDLYSSSNSNRNGLLTPHSGLSCHLHNGFVPEASKYIPYWNFQHLGLGSVTDTLSSLDSSYGCSVAGLLCFLTLPFFFFSFLSTLFFMTVSVPTQLFYSLYLPLVVFFSLSFSLSHPLISTQLFYVTASPQSNFKFMPIK